MFWREDVRKVALLTCVELWYCRLLWHLRLAGCMFWSRWGRDIAVDEFEDCGELVVDAIAAGELCARRERDPCSYEC